MVHRRQAQCRLQLHRPHLISGRRNKAALIWQGEKEMDVRCFTYQMLYTEVCRVAHALSSLHINKGDRVALYMPMIPELVIAMLACARIGAIHTAIVSGYAEGGVRSRIQGSKAKVVITADAAIRAGKIKPLKANLDPILEKCPSVAHVVVVNHADLYDVKRPPTATSGGMTSSRTSPWTWTSPASPWTPTTRSSCCIPAAAPASLRASCTPRAAT